MPHTCSTLGVRISIHALREEGDHVADTICSEWLEYFYPRPPRGGRLKGQKKVVGRYLFLSTPSARRATQKGCTGWDSQVISIHALREEGDPPQRRGITARRNFYPRPPRGGRPRLSGVPLRTLEISIHALREEGDHKWQYTINSLLVFLSTPSARRATGGTEAEQMWWAISIHALREEGDLLVCPADLGGHISIHALREEGDF